MRTDFQHASESFKRLNQHLFGLGGLPAAERKQAQVGALDQKYARAALSSTRLDGRNRTKFRIGLVCFRRRSLDSDNSIGGLKSLRDAIAASLRLDDSDRFIAWEYSQVETKGRQGVLVKLEIIS